MTISWRQLLKNIEWAQIFEVFFEDKKIDVKFTTVMLELFKTEYKVVILLNYLLIWGVLFMDWNVVFYTINMASSWNSKHLKSYTCQKSVWQQVLKNGSIFLKKWKKNWFLGFWTLAIFVHLEWKRNLQMGQKIVNFYLKTLNHYFFYMHLFINLNYGVRL